MEFDRQVFQREMILSVSNAVQMYNGYPLAVFAENSPEVIPVPDDVADIQADR